MLLLGQASEGFFQSLKKLCFSFQVSVCLLLRAFGNRLKIQDVLRWVDERWTLSESYTEAKSSRVLCLSQCVMHARVCVSVYVSVYAYGYVYVCWRRVPSYIRERSIDREGAHVCVYQRECSTGGWSQTWALQMGGTGPRCP